MEKLVTLSIDGTSVTVPAGTLIVDAARMVGIEIPVFCYHPKLHPVGMCRMCLVDVGRPVIDRATGQAQLDASGQPKISFAPKLETACTTPVSEGMRVITASEKVAAARKEMLEFLLTSHPLDCPVCDKGGECPLQNLTQRYGAAQSRFLLDEKNHLAKHVPLGELIYLDRERCIQCGRCVRFQSEVAADPVIGFYHRGRALEIRTASEPGFDSIFSGNTTDICPVGALTTADFRFGARPWEMKQAASICTHCAVGCNLTYNIRREASAGGKKVIKRAMPRQNEAVNEIWMCDKGRLGYHYAQSAQRLKQPLMRKDGALTPVSWAEALERVALELRPVGSRALTLAGGHLSNEDLYNFRQLALGLNTQPYVYTPMGGGEFTTQLGLSAGSNLGELGKGAVILVVASDLHEEAPVWWLRVKAAVERGAELIVLHPRPTRLDAYATYRLSYDYGEKMALLRSLLPGHNEKSNEAVRAAAQAFAQAENAVIFYGSEGLSPAGTAFLARTCAELLIKTGHVGRPNNGLVGVWPTPNLQGAWELGFGLCPDLEEKLSKAPVALITAADPAGDSPDLARALDAAGFVVVQELFLTETAKRADVVLPALPFSEREGSLTSGERRVQRFYPLTAAPLPDADGPRADYAILAQIGQHLGLGLEGRAPALVFARLAAEIPAFAGLTYARLAEVQPQTPPLGRKAVYFGGTAYENREGTGEMLSSGAARGEPVKLAEVESPRLHAPAGSVVLIPYTCLYDRGQLLSHTALLTQRQASPVVRMHPASAAELELHAGERVMLAFDDQKQIALLELDETLPATMELFSDLRVKVALVPRSAGITLVSPQAVKIYPVVESLQR